MQVSDFGFPETGVGPASLRERFRQRRLRRAPLLIRQLDPKAAEARSNPSAVSRTDELRDTATPRSQ